MRDKKLERGIEEVSHLFLSGQRLPDEAEKLTGREGQAYAGKSPSFSDETDKKEEREEAVCNGVAKQTMCLLFCSNRLSTESSFLACNLSIELARRDFSVGLVEIATGIANTFFLFGSHFPGSMNKQNESPLTENSPTLLPTLPALEPLKIIDIVIGSRNKINAVFLEKDLDSDDSFIIFNKLNEKSNFLIINASRKIFEFNRMICFTKPFFIVLTTVNSEELLATYSLIKRITKVVAHREIGLLIMTETLTPNAEAAFKVIAEMAHKFLSADISFMDAIPKGADYSRSIITRTPLLLKGEDSLICHAIRRLSDSLIKKYSHL